LSFRYSDSSPTRLAVRSGPGRRAKTPSPLRRTVPVRTFADWAAPLPGYMEIDQAWVEQKNGAVVRRLVGYRRLEGLAAAEAIICSQHRPADLADRTAGS
jgi:hypothetical protein